MDCLGDLELENIYLLRHAGLTHVIITKGQASKLKYEKPSLYHYSRVHI